MPLSDDDIRAFADIWKLQFGEDLTPDQARAEAERLHDFYASLVEEAADSRSHDAHKP